MIRQVGCPIGNLENVGESAEKNPVARGNILVHFLELFGCRHQSRRALTFRLVLWFLELSKTWHVFIDIWILSFESQNMPGWERGGLRSMNARPQSGMIQAKSICDEWCSPSTGVGVPYSPRGSSPPSPRDWPNSHSSTLPFVPWINEVCSSHKDLELTKILLSGIFSLQVHNLWLCVHIADSSHYTDLDLHVTSSDRSSLRMASKAPVLFSGHLLGHHPRYLLLWMPYILYLLWWLFFLLFLFLPGPPYL